MLLPLYAVVNRKYRVAIQDSLYKCWCMRHEVHWCVWYKPDESASLYVVGEICGQEDPRGDPGVLAVLVCGGAVL